MCVCGGGGGGAHREFIFELALRSSLWEAEEGESGKCTVWSVAAAGQVLESVCVVGGRGAGGGGGGGEMRGSFAHDMQTSLTLLHPVCSNILHVLKAP